MGIVTFGFPSTTVEWLLQRLNLNLFIEAGTFRGESALQASMFFERVITIEKDNSLFREANLKLKDKTNIACYNGCTRDHVIAHLRDHDRPLFWLDAHWSGVNTAGQQDECPILDELKLIFDLNLDSFALLIDDARLFTSPPPKPHDKSQWPRIDQIAKTLPDHYVMYILNDVIYILPNSAADDFSSFLQYFIENSTNPTNSTIRKKSRLANLVEEVIKWRAD